MVEVGKISHIQREEVIVDRWGGRIIFIVFCVGESKAPPVLYSSYRTVFE